MNTIYFGLKSFAQYGGLVVSPSGNVYIESNNAISRLNEDGTTTAVPQAAGRSYTSIPFSVDANEDITETDLSFFIGANWGSTQPTLTEIFAATGPVPYFPEAITMPPENGNGYPSGIFPIVPYPPSDPTYSVPFSANSTVSLSVSAATSTLPVSYQWSYNGVPIAGATAHDLLDGAFLGPGTYSVTGSTTAEWTVTASALLNWVVGGTQVGSAPVFISSPASVTIGLGTTATLSANAGATLPITFQWYLNGVAIPGANGATSSTNHRGLLQYQLTTASQTLGPTRSQPRLPEVMAAHFTSPQATVTITTTGGMDVLPAPTITSEPQSVSFSYGGIPGIGHWRRGHASGQLPVAVEWRRYSRGDSARLQYRDSGQLHRRRLDECGLIGQQSGNHCPGEPPREYIVPNPGRDRSQCKHSRVLGFKLLGRRETAPGPRCRSHAFPIQYLGSFGPTHPRRLRQYRQNGRQ